MAKKPSDKPLTDLSFDKRVELAFELNRVSETLFRRGTIIALLIIAAKLLKAEIEPATLLGVKFGRENASLLTGVMGWAMILFYSQAGLYGHWAARAYRVGDGFGELTLKDWGLVVAALMYLASMVVAISAFLLALYLGWGDLWGVLKFALMKTFPAPAI